MGEEGTCMLGPKADHMVTRRERAEGFLDEQRLQKGQQVAGVKWNPEGRRGGAAGKGSDPWRSR